MNLRFLDTDEDERTIDLALVKAIRPIGGEWSDVVLIKNDKVLIAVGEITLIHEEPAKQAVA